MLKFKVVAIFTLALVFTGCATVGVKVPVMRPAEINLKEKNELIIGKIAGRGGEKIASYVKEKAIDSERFKVIDRQHFDRVLRELKLSQSDLADSEGRKKLGKIMIGSILIMGQVQEHRYNEDMKKEKRTGTKIVNKKKVKYTYYYYKRTGTASVIVSFDVIDIETGQILQSKTAKSVKRASTSARDATPERIDGNEILDQCDRQVATDFLKAIAPWKEIVTVNFIKDKKLPMLETGINYAKAGEWNDSITQFKQAVNQADSDPKIAPKTAGKAHWNLGLAYEYTNRFDDAVIHIKKAFALSNKADYLKELKNIKRRKEDYEKLEEQLK